MSKRLEWRHKVRRGKCERGRLTYADRTVENRQEAGLTDFSVSLKPPGSWSSETWGLVSEHTPDTLRLSSHRWGVREATNAYINVNIVPAKPMG